MQFLTDKFCFDNTIIRLEPRICYGQYASSQRVQDDSVLTPSAGLRLCKGRPCIIHHCTEQDVF